MTWQWRWQLGDPADVYERIEAAEQREVAKSPRTRKQRASEGIDALFEEREMKTDDVKRSGDPLNRKERVHG